MAKNLLIATFVKKREILLFLGRLQREFSIQPRNVFVFDVEGNDFEYLTTFSTMNKDAYLGKLEGSSVMHVKNKCIFSINALNKLIDSINIDNVPSSEFRVPWDDYKDKLVIVKHGELKILKINKIQDKSIFFDN
jgi:hypothetical protein